MEIIQARAEHQPIVANLLELYSHDFSEFVDLKLDADGRFGYKHLSSYWTDANRYPFLIRAAGHWAGFVFVVRGSQLSTDRNVWDMTEFFIVRGVRRVGLGTGVAHSVWERFPGRWEVRVLERHRSALAFWAHALETFLGTPVEAIPFLKDREAWRVFAFTSEERAGPSVEVSD